MRWVELGFMWRALAAAGMVGLAAPAVGVYLVQRRLSLMGDGIGHVALTGVAAGFLTATSPVLTALIAAVIGGVAIELLRERRGTPGDLALAIVFYGGIAGGVFLTSLSDASNTNLFAFLFGSVLTVTTAELVGAGVLCAAVLGITAMLRAQLFALCYDEDVARVAGIPVRVLNLLVSVMAAVTIVVAMRVVGLLLVASLMVLPVAIAQNLSRSFRGTTLVSLGAGAVVSVAGVLVAYYLDAAPGPTIVLLALAAVFVASVAGRFVMAR